MRPSVTVDHVRDPADRSDGYALIPCPEKGGDQIAAGRCVAWIDCPKAGTCPFRARAVEAVAEAVAVTRSVRPFERNRLRSQRERVVRYCAISECGLEIDGRGMTCSIACRDKLRAERHPRGPRRLPDSHPWTMTRRRA